MAANDEGTSRGLGLRDAAARPERPPEYVVDASPAARRHQPPATNVVGSHLDIRRGPPDPAREPPDLTNPGRHQPPNLTNSGA